MGRAEPTHLVHNEQTKLTATWINTLAAALIAAGAFAPAAGGAGASRETTRMTFETLALIWPLITIGTVVAATLLVVWLQDRAHDRRTR